MIINPTENIKCVKQQEIKQEINEKSEVEGKKFCICVNMLQMLMCIKLLLLGLLFELTYGNIEDEASKLEIPQFLI